MAIIGKVLFSLVIILYYLSNHTLTNNIIYYWCSSNDNFIGLNGLGFLLMIPL